MISNDHEDRLSRGEINASPNSPVFQSHCWIHENGETVRTIDTAVGQVIGFSERSPDKQTDNEDSAGLFLIGDDLLVLAVADGMGGGNCGDRASQTVIETLGSRLQTVSQPEQVRGAILDSIEVANETILNWGIGAGSTLAVATFAAGRLRAFHVGDAVVLLCSNRGRIKYSTVAHSPVAMAVEIGVMNESEAMRHEDRNIVSNCLGAHDMRIEIGPNIKMAINDTLIVGSDGLFDNLLPQEIVSAICGRGLSKRMTDMLNVAHQRMSNHHGEHPTKPDDMTVLCFRRSKPL